MLLTLNSNDIGAISGAVAASLTVGAIFGRGVRKQLDDRQEKKREDLQIKQAVVGIPASDFSPRQPGLIEQMATLTRLANQTAEKLESHVNGGGHHQ